MPLSQTSESPNTALEAEAPAYCSSILSDVVSLATTAGSYQEPQEEHYLVIYSVNGEQITNPQFGTVPDDLKYAQEDRNDQQRVWDYFVALIPQEQRSMISEYAVFTDGQANVLATVTQSHKDPKQWSLEVDFADSSDYYNLTFTLLHEFGHLLTLNADQVPPSAGIFNYADNSKIHDLQLSLCGSYFPGEGCSQRDSYINQFYQRFWVNIYNEWDEIDQIEDDAVYYEKLNEFHTNYRDQFLTEYAATNPGEDIAESWSYFILTPKPHGDTIAEEKVLFFYEYPALVELRAEILSRLCTSFPDQNGTQ